MSSTRRCLPLIPTCNRLSFLQNPRNWDCGPLRTKGPKSAPFFCTSHGKARHAPALQPLEQYTAVLDPLRGGKPRPPVGEGVRVREGGRAGRCGKPRQGAHVGRNGRKPHLRKPLALAFLAKAVWNLPTTRALIDFLKASGTVRALCGWERAARGVRKLHKSGAPWRSPAQKRAHGQKIHRLADAPIRVEASLA